MFAQEKINDILLYNINECNNILPYELGGYASIFKYNIQYDYNNKDDNKEDFKRWFINFVLMKDETYEVFIKNDFLNKVPKNIECLTCILSIGITLLYSNFENKINKLFMKWLLYLNNYIHETYKIINNSYDHINDKEKIINRFKLIIVDKLYYIFHVLYKEMNELYYNINDFENCECNELCEQFKDIFINKLID